MGLSSYVPWWAKLGIKLGLARLPVPYALWKRIGLFRHGEMMVPERAISAFASHFQSAVQNGQVPEKFRSLELGPGDSVLSGFVARAFGAEKAWLADAGPFAETDIASCRALLELLASRGHAVAPLKSATLPDAMKEYGVVYLTDGTSSLKAIPDQSIDFTWSQVVLEHIYRDEFPALMKELRRVVAPGGIGVHSIDFRDHLGGGLNNLRFGDDVWETQAFRTSGFYTNRIRPREMIDLMKAAGFRVEVISEQRWPKLPLARDRMASQFRAFADEDFLVCEIRVIMRPV
ncbi:methyltransferase domain-containing protein [Bradyrhizobium frederickii]|uniref:Methyltransferase domain-containing protein n=1 Tax=Bradyrhizobium frederickii TaxID=2560054 RepID=A0A4Y9KY35_9BRAD|nr:methyltransferase domain-containing protein [Bradyrhizobium frederickii]TFV34844.1 methyltransferase domain-containing protein [Bradyrhizobium frederickii]